MRFTIRFFRAFAVILAVLPCFTIAQNVYGEALGKAVSKRLPQRAMERLLEYITFLGGKKKCQVKKR